MFHVLLERIEPPSTTNTPTNARNVHSELQLLFSPTIQLNCPQQNKLLLRAAGLFGIISSLARSGCENMQSLHAPQTSQEPSPTQVSPPRPHIILHINELLHSARLEKRPNLRLFRVRDLPVWFPGKENNTDAAHVIQVKPQTFAKFMALDNRKVSWLYNFFFIQAILTASENFRFPSRSEKPSSSHHVGTKAISMRVRMSSTK